MFCCANRGSKLLLHHERHGYLLIGRTKFFFASFGPSKTQSAKPKGCHASSDAPSISTIRLFFWRIITVIKLLVFVFAICLVFNPVELRAQEGPYASVNIGGVPMFCISRFGQQVPIWIDPRVRGMIGISRPGPNPTIQIDPMFFSRVPALTGQFWFLHECAHQVVGGSEAAADCYAIRNLRDLELIRSSGDVRYLLDQIASMSGTSRHLPGPARAQNIWNCLNS